MKKIDSKLLTYITQKNLADKFFKAKVGLEKENVRVDEAGMLALTPHPKAFGDKLYNPYIKTDFSESQVEVVTPICDSSEEAYNFLENLQNIVSLSLQGEYLWPQSCPPILPEDIEIPIAVYANEGMEERNYRERLAQKYGKKKQLLSGIHYNYSLDESFLRLLYKEFGGTKDYQEFRNTIYLKLAKNFLKHRWFLIYLTGASPIFHKTYEESYIAKADKLDDESYYFKDLSSLRNSRCGYKNKEDFIVNYDSLDAYIASIQDLIDNGKIESLSEFYNPIRLKCKNKKGALEQLKAEGIKYLELRIFDLNPFNKNGIFLEDLHLTNLFMMYMLLIEDEVFDQRQQEIANLNHDLSTLTGKQEGISIYDETSTTISLQEAALKIIDGMLEMIQSLNINVEHMPLIIEMAREKIINPERTYAFRLIEAVKQHSFIDFHMQKAKEFLKDSRQQEFKLVGYEDLELSTQILIKDAVRRGIEFSIFDREENFIQLRRGSKIEYVKQATKTSKDPYVTVLIMENKVVTKDVLKQNNIIVPAGESFNALVVAKQAYNNYEGKKIVIKPKSTNFGIGISIFKDSFTKDEFFRAVEIAFEHDKTILIEEFISGKEYRFLVINNEVVGVLHRVPANVQGDGKRTIRELVAEKNRDPLRGRGYKTPLEKIVLGEIEETFLKAQGKTFDYIPGKDEVVYLRENSNISTGGDSIDFTDLVHESYKKTAIKSAQAVGAVICGVDMMIEDIAKPQDDTNYAIIELNFNPAIHIHCYPYQGTNRRAGEKVLDLLFGS